MRLGWLELAGGGQSASSFSVDIQAIMQQEPANVSRAANDPSVFGCESSPISRNVRALVS